MHLFVESHAADAKLVGGPQAVVVVTREGLADEQGLGCLLRLDEGARGVKYDDYVGPTTGLRFGFPLSPRFMLTGEYLPARDQAMKVDAAWVAQANQAQIYRALREIYASFCSCELREKVDRIHAIRKPVIPAFPTAWE